ncbi:MAG: transcription termination factor Rho [Clostridiales bacterium]|nr:transcription termination factor Rho [Clostridiales bacterium]
MSDSKTEPKTKAKRSAPKKKTEEKKTDEKPSEETASESPVKEEKAEAPKRSRKTKSKEETKENKEETPSVSNESQQDGTEIKAEEKKASGKSSDRSSKKKTKTKEITPETQKEELSNDRKIEVSNESKEELSIEPQEGLSNDAKDDASNEKKDDASKDQKSSKKNSRGKKKAKNEDTSEVKTKEDAQSEDAAKEEKKEDTENTSEVSSEESSEASVKNDGAADNVSRNQGKNKKQKGRHRSVEIRPAGEASVPSDTEDSTSEEKASENNGENAKPQIEPIEFVGVLEIVSDGGYGFVRRENYLPSPQDVFVPTNLIRRFGLRIGDQIRGFALPKRGQEKNLALSYITMVNDVELDKLGRRPHFERLTPIYPDERFRLETGKQELSTRIIDLVSPIGKGQRGMIVSPPKAGKTILLQKIANAITQNSPKTKLIVLLIDERPEEVTDMQRSIKGEVVYSTFDKKPENHTRVTELVLERAMRLVEMGEDVVILLDSMTRLARAYNLTITPTGRTLSGGLDPGSLYGPKRFFGAARNIENGGSLTIVATSLIETGSRMDEVIFEEFKGTGNMEVYLDRKLSEKRIFPAIDINKSGTRREDLLMSQEELDAVWTIRKAFSQMETAPVTETIINLLLRTNSNDHFIRSVKVSFADKEVFDAMRGTGANGKD